MQISGSAAASHLLSLQAASSTVREAPEAQGEVPQKSEPTAVAELPSTPAPTPGEDFMAGLLERLRFSAQENADHDHHHGRDSDRKQVRRELKQIERAVRHELKDLGKSLAGEFRADGLEDTAGIEEGVDVRHELKHLGQDFKHELKHAFEDAGEGHHFDPEALVDAVRTAFDNLLAGLQSILGSPEMPVADDQPADAPLSETAALVDPSALPAAVVEEEGVSAEISTEPAAELPGAPPTAGDLSAPLQELLQSFTDRFPSLLSQLEDLLAALGELQVDGEAEPAGESQAASRTQFDLVISAYTQVSFSLSIQEGAGVLDSVA